MNILPSVLLALLPLLLPLANAFAQSDQQPPTAIIVQEDFSPMQSQWEPESGTWSVANGTYGNSSAGATDITRITFYRDVHPAGPGDSVVTFQDFTVSARMRNGGTSDAHLVGLIYGYQDSQNYYEVVVSAIGTVRMRTVMSGIAVDEQPAAHLNIPRNTWFDVEVRWNRGVASLKVNGIDISTAVSQPEFTTGQIGLITHAAVGRFDKVFLGVPFGDQDFLEDFDEPPFVTFTPLSGQWSIAHGIYQNSAVQQTNITLAPIQTGGFPNQGDTFEYTFRARMLNPYGASGNLVGIVFNYRTIDYTELVFSPTGVARLNRFENGAVHTIATASYGGTRNVPIEVTIENGPNHFAVIVNGQRLFQDMIVFGVNPEQFPEGGVGLITHWAPGRFDNVEFNLGFFSPCSETFDDEPFQSSIVSGAWDVNGGTLNSTAVGVSDVFDELCFAGTNYVYSARLRNQYGASGNLVGLIYNYQHGFYGGDYYEVLFSSTGIVQLNKFIEGVRYPVKTATHSIPRNTWFGVQVIHSGIRTKVKVNGTTAIDGEIQGELQGGSIGAITHWTKGHFDNLSLIELVPRPPSEL
jgi:hypothetical protein